MDSLYIYNDMFNASVIKFLNLFKLPMSSFDISQINVS